MKQWSAFRRGAWKIDHRWTAPKLLGHSELRKGREWEPLVNAPAGIVRLDLSVAELANCAEQTHDWEDEYPFSPDWDDDYEPVQLHDDREWYAQERKRNQAREREAEVLLVHYLLPHVRLYGKLRALELGERAYYYRLSSALDSLHRYYADRVERTEDVQW